MAEGKNFIHETARIQGSVIGEVKLYRNVWVNDCRFGNGVSIGDDSTIERSVFEPNVVINRRSYVNDSTIGTYSYAGINTTINWSDIGRFCSIGRNVDIGGIDHDYHKITSMLDNRIRQMMAGGGKYTQVRPKHDLCMIGSDVWIAAGAQVLHKVKVGDGAVIGAGAVVTHDVPPYAIVAGVPGKVIGLRCEEALCERLCQIKWWDWPSGAILENYQYLLAHDISKESVDFLEEINKKVINGEYGNEK